MSQQARIDKLKKIYYDPASPGSYGGVNRLFKAAKAQGLVDLKREEVVNFLRDQESYTLHKPARRNFKRNRTYVRGIDHQWQADLADMQEIAADNDGYRYILTCIDCFSKYAWAVPVKAKSGAAMLEGMRELFEMAAPRKPVRLQTDAGKEFLNKDVQKFLKQKGVHHFVSYSDKKAAIVERWNRTIKNRLWTSFSAHQTRRYVDILPEIVDAYNHSYHRTIGQTPASVKKADEDRLWARMFGDGGEKGEPKPVPPNTKVRVSKVKGVFEKGYLPNWSQEYFLAHEQRDNPKRVYKLTDAAGEEIKGSWYPEELQKIENPKYLVEKILRRRTNPKTKKREFLIKWQGWPAKFNSWITEDDFEDVDQSK